jgi:hypothetical protein
MTRRVHKTKRGSKALLIVILIVIVISLSVGEGRLRLGLRLRLSLVVAGRALRSRRVERKGFQGSDADGREQTTEYSEDTERETN